MQEQKYCLYIVLTRPKTTISRLIQLITKDEYTHAAISLDKKLNHMFSFGRKTFYNPFYGGFVQERLDQGLYKHHKTLPGIIMEIEVSENQYVHAKHLLNHFISQRNSYKYNYKGLLHNLLQKESCYRDRFLCSEFVYFILQECGIIDFQISRNLIRPQSLLQIKGRIVYQGNLKQYNIRSKEGIKTEVLKPDYALSLNKPSLIRNQ